MFDFIFDFVSQALAEIIGDLFGQRFQRRRSARLARRGRLTCAMRDPDGRSSTRKWQRGTAELSDRTVHFKGVALAVESVALPGVTKPESGSESEQILWFDPEVRILRLMTSAGPREWAILEWQTQWAIDRLGIAAN